MSAPSDTAIDTRPIKTDADLDRALRDVELLWGANLVPSQTWWELRK